MENENYESYDDDFDTDYESGVPEGNTDTENVGDRSMSEVDAVADLLMGGDGSGHTPKENDSGFRSRDLDSHGRVDHGDTKQEAPQQTSQTIYSQQVAEQMTSAADTWDKAHKQNARLDEMLKNNEISQEDHFAATHQLGQLAASAKEQMYQARIAQLEHGSQREAQFKELESLGEDFSPEKRDDTLRAIVNYASERGISHDVLSGVETKQEAEFLYNAMKNEQTVKELKLQLAGKSQKLREANRALGKGRHTAQKSSQLGTRSGTDTQIEQVMQILAGADAPKGGRRR